MKKEEVNSKEAPQAIGPYSQAVKWGNFVFCSGQIAVDPKTNTLIEGDVRKQTEQVFENLQAVLTSAGADLDTTLKVTVYLKNMDDFPLMNEIYAKYFMQPYPARATIEVAKLPKGALIEIECIAYIDCCSPSHKPSEDKRGGCKGDCQCNCK